MTGRFLFLPILLIIVCKHYLHPHRPIKVHYDILDEEDFCMLDTHVTVLVKMGAYLTWSNV
jgi:hypothetical protein